MKNKIFHGLVLPAIPFLVLFTGMFIWFAFFGNYVLFFQEKSSLFLFTLDYFIEKTGQPGGAMDYFSKFLTSFFYYPIAGAAILSGLITLTSRLISRCLFLLSGRNEKIFPFIIGLLLFYLHTNYSFFLTATFGVMMQLLLFLAVIRTEKHTGDTVIFFTLPAWYFLTGGFSWIFMFLVTFRWLIFYTGHRWIKILSIWLLMALVIMISKEFIFFESEKNLIFYPYNLPDEALERTLFLLATILTCITPLIAWIKFPAPNLLSSSYSSEISVRSIVVISITLLIAVYQFDRKNAQYFRIERLFYEGKHEQIIKENTLVPSTNLLTLFFNNISLAEKGILNDRLFGFLQSPNGQTLYLKWEMVSEILKRGGYFYYTLGMINEAHRWAFENMVMEGHTPEGLKLLIKTELINGNYFMAGKYISLLKRTLFYRKDADRFEKILFNDQLLEMDTELGQKRKINVKRDFFSITDDPFLNLERVCLSDSVNNIAFDYMIAAMLLKKDYKGISEKLSLFEKKGYSAFPVHVQEAILAISTMNNEKLNLGGLKVDRITEERWTQFLTVFQQYGNNPRTAEPALRKQFGNTFWYWAFYK